jgi:hypothetical protein
VWEGNTTFSSPIAILIILCNIGAAQHVRILAFISFFREIPTFTCIVPNASLSWCPYCNARLLRHPGVIIRIFTLQCIKIRYHALLNLVIVEAILTVCNDLTTYLFGGPPHFKAGTRLLMKVNADTFHFNETEFAPS